MGIIGMNHAVLYVRDARIHKDFYSRVLGFTTNIEDRNGQFVFMRAPNSKNHHDVAFFSIGKDAFPSNAGQKSVGLYHVAWEVETLAELEEVKITLEKEGPDLNLIVDLFGKDKCIRLIERALEL